MDKHFWVEVGDQVVVNPEYWDEDLIEPYYTNGPDHIYTVTSVNLRSDGIILVQLDDNDDRWENNLELLLPVEQSPDFEIADDVFMLFDEVNA